MVISRREYSDYKEEYSCFKMSKFLISFLSRNILSKDIDVKNSSKYNKTLSAYIIGEIK